MPAGEKRRQDLGDDRLLADDHSAELALKPASQFGGLVHRQRRQNEVARSLDRVSDHVLGILRQAP